MTFLNVSWVLPIVSLPTSSATARIRIWRTLKALGCMALRDGAYLLPTLRGLPAYAFPEIPITEASS